MTSDLITVALNSARDLVVVVNGWILVALVVLGGGAAILSKRRWGPRIGDLEIDEAEIGLGNQKLTLRPNAGDLQIAYALWVELTTRKIGLEIDLDNDVISEVYDSWYAFFGVTRELIKAIPATKIRSSATTRQLVNLAVDVLNLGLRPHLTRWQARFRRWWTLEIAKPERSDAAPQDLQKGYPLYKELTDDMMRVNKRLVAYRSAVRRVVQGDADVERPLKAD